ncbi:MAG: zf-HC2 domain-containing protein [Desulfobacteraceae bacterium]|nr:zf-HC2 domain-containing protein [Desulfobacteraceae bacterium]
MKKAHHECDEELIGRYFDGELSQEEYDSISRHLKDCPSCQKTLQDNQAISTVFRDNLEREVSQADFGVLETRVLDQIRQKENPWWERITKLFFSNKLLIPATALAVLILFFAIMRSPTTISGPSAIIEAFSGEVSSVMIIETPKSHQTIIWYKETS